MKLSAQAKARLNALFAATAAQYGIAASNAIAGVEYSPSSEQAVAIFNALRNNPAASELYAATPTRRQTAELLPVQLAQPFLNQIPLIPVSEIAGQKVLVGLSGRVGSRTDTSSSGERTPKTLLSTGTQDYDAKATEFDVGITYADIDAWAKFPNFQELYMQAVRNAIAIDMLQTGWTGTSAAASTNIGSNPLLQDLNIGWLQKLRTYNSGSQYHVGTGPSPISIGASTGVYKNLDHLVRDSVETVGLAHRDRDDLVALISRNLVASQENTYYKTNGNQPTEKIALEGIVRKAYGGLPSVIPPFFPNGTILITPMSNIAIYYQDSSVRRLQRDWPSKNQVQEFNSMNLAYVVQDENACSLVENITLVS